MKLKHFKSLDSPHVKLSEFSNSICFRCVIFGPISFSSTSVPLFLSTKHLFELHLRADRVGLIRLHGAQTVEEVSRHHPLDFSFNNK